MGKANRWYLKALCWSLAATILGVGCSASSSTNSTPHGVGGSSGSHSGKDAGSKKLDSGSGNPAGSGATGGSGGEESTWRDASLEDGACAAFSSEAKQIEVQVPTEVEVEVTRAEPVAIYIMLDRTGSMGDMWSGSGKWQTAVTSINTFVADPLSENIWVALQYFSSEISNVCDGVYYDTPAVPMGRLPNNAQAISDSLAATSPGGNTPLEAALRGLTSYCIAFQQDTANNPNKMKCVAVLVSDGQPTSCDEDINALAAIASDAYASDGVQTFAVGMAGADFNALALIAQAGNAPDCDPAAASTPATYNACDVSSGMTLLEAFEKIRSWVTELKTVTEMQTVMTSQKLPCEWSIPEPPENETFDKGKVNVQFSPTGEAKDSETFGMASSKEKCGDAGNAWYYDDPDNPTKILACPATCDVIKAAEKAAVNILFGCETELILG